MRLALTSDLHGDLPQIPTDVDAVILAGDICPDFAPRKPRPFAQVRWPGTERPNSTYQYQWFRRTFVPWLEQLARWVPHIIIVAGNHDVLFAEPHFDKLMEGLPCIYLQDQDVTLASAQGDGGVSGVVIYGSPWTPTEPAQARMQLAFEEPDVDLAERWANIPETTDILVLHGPPYQLGDLTKRGEYIGSRSCANHLRWKMKKLPKLIVVGHVHEARGEVELPEWCAPSRMFNVCYTEGGDPIVVELEDVALKAGTPPTLSPKYAAK
jgi:Icc-related predicted phosphoesterase